MQWPIANVDWLCLASFWLLSHTEFLTSIASIYLYITIRRSFCLMFAVHFHKYTKLLLTSFINGYLNLFRSLFHEFGFSLKPNPNHTEHVTIDEYQLNTHFSSLFNYSIDECFCSSSFFPVSDHFSVWRMIIVSQTFKWFQSWRENDQFRDISYVWALEVSNGCSHN